MIFNLWAADALTPKKMANNFMDSQIECEAIRQEGRDNFFMIAAFTENAYDPKIPFTFRFSHSFFYVSKDYDFLSDAEKTKNIFYFDNALAKPELYGLKKLSSVEVPVIMKEDGFQYLMVLMTCIANQAKLENPNYSSEKKKLLKGKGYVPKTIAHFELLLKEFSLLTGMTDFAKAKKLNKELGRKLSFNAEEWIPWFQLNISALKTTGARPNFMMDWQLDPIKANDVQTALKKEGENNFILLGAFSRLLWEPDRILDLDFKRKIIFCDAEYDDAQADDKWNHIYLLDREAKGRGFISVFDFPKDDEWYLGVNGAEAFVMLITLMGNAVKKGRAVGLDKDQYEGKTYMPEQKEKLKAILEKIKKGEVWDGVPHLLKNPYEKSEIKFPSTPEARTDEEKQAAEAEELALKEEATAEVARKTAATAEEKAAADAAEKAAKEARVNWVKLTFGKWIDAFKAVQ